MIFQGIYRGIIVQNNDPLCSGRVKVFVPGVNLTQIEGWNQKLEEDIHFKVPGSNTGSSLTTQILENQKNKLFWAEVMMPLVGANAPGTYNAASDQYQIGNDSDYNFQRGNKETAAFIQDAAQAVARLASPPPPPSYGKAPRTQPLLNFPQSGAKFCVNTGCKKDKTPTVSPFTRPSPATDVIFGELPKTYQDEDLVLDPVSPDSSPNSDAYLRDIANISTIPLANNSVMKVSVAVNNPDIFLDDKLIPKDSPIYNPGCFTTPVTGTPLRFNPPINFKQTTGIPSGILDDLPVNLTINEKEVNDFSFTLHSSDDNSITYIKDRIKVVVPRENIEGVDIMYTNDAFNFARIKSIQPIIKPNASAAASSASAASSVAKSVFGKKIIMPRVPSPSGQPIISRGGGGGEIFNNVISTLLPILMRLDAHIGGANNECRMTCNKGRTPSNDPNNIKGCNFRGNVGQTHRGPMRAPDYNNDWKGIISIPGIGAHVWVMFERGDPNYPVIIGTFASQENYKGIYEAKPVEVSDAVPPEDPAVAAPADPTAASGVPITTPTGGTDGNGPDASLFPEGAPIGDAGAPVEDSTGTPVTTPSAGAVPITGRQTSFGYKNDPYWDSNSGAGIGAFVPDAEEIKIRNGQESTFRLREGDIAVSPDIESQFRSSGVKPGQSVKINYIDGTSHTGRWMDKTSSALRGRIDLYSPDGANKRDGIKVTTFERAI